MDFRNDFIVNEEVRRHLVDIFSSQYAIVENHTQKLFSFTDGAFAQVKEYYHKLSYEHLNLVHSHEGTVLMSVFAITGKRSIKIEKLLNTTGLRCLGIRVYKGQKVPMHIDANYENMGRGNPVCSITISASPQAAIFLGNKSDGSYQAAIPASGVVYFMPTEIEHGGYAADQDMDIVQIMVDSF